MEQNCSECAESMGEYADMLCNQYKSKLSKLVHFLKNDLGIDPCWDGDRHAWLIFVDGEQLPPKDTPDQPFDPVNNPEHYASGSLECIDWIEAMMTDEEFRGYLKGNVLKYLWRYEDKGKPAQDLGKARWYLDRLIGIVDSGYSEFEKK